ncbi:MAG: GIY-YIG nuclease family protein [Eubacteriales bacterium]|nr:GIY-YIG nuclease family protein [Clostridiales bacterium]MDY5720525.1 GIY-YIG nuclease family protein [Eubacteriales bacterium]
MKTYYVYIMTNVDNTVLYTGVTDDIERRVTEHKNHTLKGFTDKYNVTKCVYVEEYGNINDAIMREKQIKGWSRARKFDLINTTNPVLKDLGE